MRTRCRVTSDRLSATSIRAGEYRTPVLASLVVEEQGKERSPAEIGREGEEQSQLGQEREGALEPSEEAVRPQRPED